MLTEVVDDGLDIALLVHGRHVQGVVVTSAVDGATGKIEDIYLIPYSVQRLKISAAVVMRSVEAVGDNGYGLFPARIPPARGKISMV